ncbi:MAG TPA: TetR family transcriptional regulator [Acidimicrobiales bacterium]
MLPVAPPPDTPPADALAAPARAGRRERNRHRVRTAILDAALELFAERGFEQTTVRDIAARAGVSTATVSRYFPVKEAMLFGEAEVRTAALYDAVRSRPAGEPPTAAVVAGLVHQPELDADGRARMLASRRAIARSTVARGRAGVYLDAWRGAIARALRDRGTDTAEAEVVAAAAVAVLDAVADRWARAGGRGDLRVAMTAGFSAIGWTIPEETA